MEDETWFLETSQRLMKTDIYAARSWLLTAKSIFPQSFRLQIEEYILELNKKNTEECSKVLNELFRDFPREPVLWEEIEKIIVAVENSNDSLRKAIFEGLPSFTQQRMILASAESRVNIAQYCRLCIVLMKKFPETVSQYGLELVEKLVESEKKNPEGTPVNHYRKLLVCEVLPVMCLSGNLSLSLKHFYKWLQKATEFYVCYFTSGSESTTESIWSDLEDLRSNIAQHCSWSEEKKLSKSLTDRMTFVRDLFRQSRTDVDGAVNRKQIFYTTLILLFQASSIYMLGLCSTIYRDGAKEDSNYIILSDIEEDSSTNQPIEHLPPQKSTDINDYFQVAKEAWTILHSNETFEKDFNHLLRRWKCDRWFWLQLFLCHYHLYSGDFDSALVRLRQIEQRFDTEPPRREIQVRVYCHLAFSCFSLGLQKESCSFVFKSISLLPSVSSSKLPDTTNHVTNTLAWSPTPKLHSPLVAVDPSSPSLILIQVHPSNLMPFWIRILIESLQQIAQQPVVSDSVLGHLLVLSQYNWPFWRSQTDKVFERITEKKTFNFDLFFQFIINIDILEEVAYLKNNKSCHIVLSSKQNTSTGHVTRGANEKAEEEFRKAITANVQRSSDDIDLLLRSYLTTHKDAILTLLDSVTSD